MADTCDAEGCERPAHTRSRLCAGHAKRIERGDTSGAPIKERLTLRERVLNLAIGLADADSEDEKAYGKSWDALEHGVVDWGDAMRGRRGGEARAKAMSPEERSENARIAALALAQSMTPMQRQKSAQRAGLARAAALSP